MALGPMEIHHKEFNTVRMGGYNKEEVDAFLDQVADEMDRLLHRGQELAGMVEGMRAKVVEYDGMQQTLQNALINAQRSADGVIQNAQARADELMKQADAEAANRAEETNRRYEEAMQQINAQVEKATANLASLRTAAMEYISNVRSLLNETSLKVSEYESVITEAEITIPEMPAAAPITPAFFEEQLPVEQMAEPMVQPDYGEAIMPEYPAAPMDETPLYETPAAPITEYTAAPMDETPLYETPAAPMPEYTAAPMDETLPYEPPAAPVEEPLYDRLISAEPAAEAPLYEPPTPPPVEVPPSEPPSSVEALLYSPQPEPVLEAPLYEPPAEPAPEYAVQPAIEEPLYIPPSPEPAAPIFQEPAAPPGISLGELLEDTAPRDSLEEIEPLLEEAGMMEPHAYVPNIKPMEEVPEEDSPIPVIETLPPDELRPIEPQAFVPSIHLDNEEMREPEQPSQGPHTASIDEITRLTLEDLAGTASPAAPAAPAGAPGETDRELSPPPEQEEKGEKHFFWE